MASIVIDVESNKKSIHPMIYSNFIEHLGDCIHNGLWNYENVSVPMCSIPRLDRVREDVLEASKSLRISVLRAFGGCYSDVYHWKDAIGPREQRKKCRNAYWGAGIKMFVKGLGPKIENQFGTDEFLIFCEEIGAKPYLNVNYGTGTPEEAADWVEYCNGSEDTKWGKIRAENGRKKPYNVLYWGIANEIFGWWEKGHEKHPEDYAKKYLKFAKVMREKDPNIKLIACGCQKSGWNRTLLKLLKDDWVDYLSIHRYMPGLWTTFIRRKAPKNKKLYHALMGSPVVFKEHIEETWGDITSALGANTKVRIAFDEWGVWYTARDIIRTNYNLQDGVWVALILLVLQQMSDKCPMANWSQLINCIGTFQTRGDDLWLTPVYLAIKMFVDHTYLNIIENIMIESETFNSKNYAHVPKENNIPYISCNATIDDSGENLAIILINKHFSNNKNVTFKLVNYSPSIKGTIIELNSSSPFDYNTKNDKEKIKIIEKEVGDIRPEMSITLPAHSVSILKISKK